MKISDITISDLKSYAKVDSTDEDAIFTNILAASKQYIFSQTGLTPQQADLKEDLSMALMIIASDMYDNRAYTTQTSRITNVNAVVDSIIGQYCVNLL
ncbi:MAG: head-tail connector protein [Oscillospiraceae bacterium]